MDVSIYHDILGVDLNCTGSEIREKYRELCKKYHPDLAGSDTTDIIALINEAHDALLKKTKPEKAEKPVTPAARNNTAIQKYRDQAYAYYRQGIRWYKDTYTFFSRLHLALKAISRGTEQKEKYLAIMFRAIYYLNTICTRFPESEYADDSREKIGRMNRYLKMFNNSLS